MWKTKILRKANNNNKKQKNIYQKVLSAVSYNLLSSWVRIERERVYTHIADTSGAASPEFNS